MSLLDANLSRLDNQKNISLPPISSIIKSIDQQQQQQPLPNVNSTSPNSRNNTLLQNQNPTFPSLVTNPSYQAPVIVTDNTNSYTYNTFRSLSQDSITSTSTPSIPLPIIPNQQSSIPYTNLPITQTLQIPQQRYHHDSSLSPSTQSHLTPSPTISNTSINSSTSPVSNTSLSQSLPNTTSQGNKRKYTCRTCTKSFTTSGHLARHSRIHTGERKHICPHPNCESRFARQDNCMQHYKTHLNNKLKRRKYTKKV
ncbi:Zinc finger and SCAN domain-containing protein 20 [Wickerhamomyces ciferrii]|uniref:Zinc finger and SCAN domain-containing protein 20 n=1 Tax=Wickerhamomyces ciferrii (strain ATCC 14091 / BCRC 22168 / CBS 111 / JCM 3599 / NBRC 0793 / NRRL Y-1031 F-60-10) TaxID=1206466 RepID=K0KSI7_WICCF|nr:Zinc finger and SCAN domain-containing protein 20 [Wickerhamomyces ciferrii]CCH44294.1 Zinc finger and SCAN domain-containing protein 20 [Wickerhamomyces ciferrii]